MRVRNLGLLFLHGSMPWSNSEFVEQNLNYAINEFLIRFESDTGQRSLHSDYGQNVNYACCLLTVSMTVSGFLSSHDPYKTLSCV